ncbi:hypothetical protein D3C81_959160 [compost metagenome]
MGKSGLVDSVIDLMKQNVIELVDFAAKLFRIKIRRTFLMKRLECRLEVVGQPEIVVVHDLSRSYIDYRRHRCSSAVFRIGLRINLRQITDTQHRINAALIERKLPAILRTYRTGSTQTDHALQTQQFTYDYSTVRPRANLCP